jgi:hypothetical protein
VSEPPATYVARATAAQPLIRNCRFAFRCHQQWRALEKTTDPAVRYCHECSLEVVPCRRDAELRAALQADRCVAIEQAGAPAITHTVGVIHPFGGED